MIVWVVIHHEYGCATLREIYATLEAAEVARVSRTPSGRRSTAFDAHDEHCCEVDEWEVEGA